MKVRVALVAVLVFGLCGCSTVPRTEDGISGRYVLDGPPSIGSILILRDDGTCFSDGKQYENLSVRGFGPGTYTVRDGVVTLKFSDARFSRLKQKLQLTGNTLVATGGQGSGSVFKDGVRFVRRSD